MLKDLFLWWWETVRPLVRRRAKAGAGPERIVVRRNVFELSSSDTVETFAAEDEEAMTRLAARIRTMKLPPVVDIEAGRYVVRTLSPLRLPFSRARTIAALDLAASTPFEAGDVFALQVRFADPSETSPTAYVIVKRSILQPLIQRLRSAAKPASEIGLLAAGDDGSREWIVTPNETRALTAPSRVAGRTLRIAGAALGLVLAVTFVHAHWRLSAAQARAKEQLPMLEEAARAVRDELDQRSSRIAAITALRQSLVTQRSMSELLEDLSRVLPDSAYLTNLAVREGSATLVGFARSASSIIEPIETEQHRVFRRPFRLSAMRRSWQPQAWRSIQPRPRQAGCFRSARAGDGC